MSPHRFARMYLLVLGLLALPGVFLFLPGGSAGATTDPALLAQSVQTQASQGQPLFEEHCSTCHGAQGQGTENGPAIVGLGPAFYDFLMSTGRMPLDFPTQQAIRRRPVLSRREIDAITAYLVSLAPGSGIPIPSVHAAAGDISVGQQTYELNCAPCHGTTANGGAVGPQDAPSLHQSTATQIGEAVRIGPGTMPVFGKDTLSDPSLDSVVRYVLYLRHPEDRGGQPLNRTGPLVEGFVALLVGLGVLVVITRFIGTRS
jgi:ubiquinol-cytochrome c reductase cytochrome c subunit